MKTARLMTAAAALSGLAVLAPETDTGTAPVQPNPDSANPGAPVAINPEAAAQAAAADQAATAKAGSGEKGSGGKGVHMVWVQPGHESLGIGQMILVSKAEAETLRGAGRARYASEPEVKAGKDHALKLEGI